MDIADLAKQRCVFILVSKWGVAESSEAILVMAPVVAFFSPILPYDKAGTAG